MSPNGQAIDALLTNEPGVHFLGHPHTLANFESAFWRSSNADNGSFEQWDLEGAKDANLGRTRSGRSCSPTTCRLRSTLPSTRSCSSSSSATRHRSRTRSRSGDSGKHPYDFVIVGGGSAGCVLANRLSEDPSTRVLVLEAGRPDYSWDVFIHMPAALSFPIGNRFYDWKYESEPEPHMDGRRIYHARGKVLGGSLEHQRDDLPARQPARLRALGRRPGDGTWDYAHCLPYFKRMETCLAGADEYRGGDGPLVLERGPATSPLFQAFFEAVQQAGYPLTDDVNGYRQEGFAAFDRNIHRGRRLSAARAYLHPVMGGRTSTCGAARSSTGSSSTARARSASSSRAGGARARSGRRGDPLRRRDQLAAAAPALGRRQRRASSRRSGSTSCTTCPASARTSRTTSRSTSSTACTQPVSMAPCDEVADGRGSACSGCSSAPGPGATNHFEAGGFVRSNDDVAYPNVMFHFLPIAIRYDGSLAGGRHGYQVHVGPMYSDARGSVKITSTDPREQPALRFNYLSTDQDRREWVETVRVARRS